VETPVRPSLTPRNTFEEIQDMAINVLSLPTDIPWRRLAISRDTYATSLATRSIENEDENEDDF